MRRALGLTTLLGLLAVAAYVLKDQVWGGLKLGGKPSPLESRWHTEEEWLVDSIVRDIAEMARFASAGRIPGEGAIELTVGKPAAVPGGVKVSVALRPGLVVERELPLATYVWSPDEYRPLAKALLDAAGAVPASSPDDGSDLVLTSLTDLRAGVIEQADARVSSALERRFTDPALHEAAALVLAAFTLREAAATYSDVRAGLCRVAAHLAVAQALRAEHPPGLEGRFARAALALLAGRGAEAAADLDALDRASDPRPGPRAWRRALRLRLGEDTRIEPSPGTLVERRETYRALLRTVDARLALEARERLGLDAVTDGRRLANEVGLSVEEGNVLLEDAVDEELAEVRQVWTLSRERPLGEPEIVAALNEPAERCVGGGRPRVIGWGTWAAFLQRHVIESLSATDDHLRHVLGLPQDADRAWKQIERRFGGLRLFPFVEAKVSMNGSHRPTRFNDLVTVIVREPEAANVLYWWAAGEGGRYEVVRRAVPDVRPWVGTGLPRGTTFDFAHRNFGGLLPRRVEALRVLHAVSPNDFAVTDALASVEFKPGQGRPEDIRALFGPRADYDIRVLERLSAATEDDDAAHERILERECALTVWHCYNLGFHRVRTGDIAGAVRAYEDGLARARDEVGASHNILWLMNHYLDEGNVEKARALAERAVGTGSGPGMIAMSRFRERTSDFAGADQQLRALIARYGNRPQTPEEREEARDGRQDEDELIGFYYRMVYVRKMAAYEPRFLELTRKDFPQGLEHLEPHDFAGRPEDGVFVLKSWPYAERAGIKMGDIVVGLDGFRVRTRRQYMVVRSFSDSPEMTLLLFRHPGMREVKARSVSRHLGFDMRSHKPVNTAAAERP
jgi:hypothetical protein